MLELQEIFFRLAVIIAMDYVFFIPGIESISRLYYSWIVPKYFIVENKRVYLIRTVVANENKWFSMGNVLCVTSSKLMKPG